MGAYMGTTATWRRGATDGLKAMKAHPQFVVLFVGLLLIALFAFAGPAEAQEKSLELPGAEVVAEVQPDGSVLITEEITYGFTGHFEGGYREIPLEDGMSVDRVSVSEGGEQYEPGASAGLGSEGAPGTFGTYDLGDRYRIVWHFRATDEQRTFEIRYRLGGSPWPTRMWWTSTCRCGATSRRSRWTRSRPRSRCRARQSAAR